MKYILSMNNKFFNVNPKENIKKIKEYNKEKKVYGFEICANSSKEKRYVIKFTKLAKKEGYIVNLHSPSFEKTNDYFKYFKFAEKLAKIQNRKVNVVIHPLNDIKENEKFVKNLLEFDIKNVEISIENLNILDNQMRPVAKVLQTVLKENDNLKFTYDIGHELVDHNVNELPQICIDRTNNIHLHYFKNSIDHYPVTEEIPEITKKLSQITNNVPIVLEYALDFIDGNTYYDKLENYIGLIDVFDFT